MLIRSFPCMLPFSFQSSVPESDNHKFPFNNNNDILFIFFSVHCSTNGNQPRNGADGQSDHGYEKSDAQISYPDARTLTVRSYSM